MSLGQYIIIFNGEIYNYIELKELKTYGLNFKTDTDTEVILQAYKTWSDNCFKKFNGMWSLAIYNTNEKKLTRDRMGKKPLYYYKKNNLIVFASELNLF